MFQIPIAPKFVAVWLLGLVLLAASPGAELLASSLEESTMQRGVSWVGAARIDASHVDLVRGLGANWIVQEPFAWQRDPASPEITLSIGVKREAYWGESDEGIRVTTRLARESGLRTLLKPHIWLRGGGWVGDIRMDDEAAWGRWFASYRTFILHYARLAEELEIEALCIGTELKVATVEHPARWRALIREIREVYHGRLTYAANWHGEYDRIEFWDALDFIGVQAYFPLTDKARPTIDDLVNGWRPHVAALRTVSRRFGKPIVFTEIGYRSIPTAAASPWGWPEHDGERAQAADQETQSRCFEAFFRSTWREDWFAGAYIWKWHPHGPDARRGTATDFTPQGKAAENVIRNWYSSAP